MFMGDIQKCGSMNFFFPFEKVKILLKQYQDGMQRFREHTKTTNTPYIPPNTGNP